jgi:hypothetical protein
MRIAVKKQMYAKSEWSCHPDTMHTPLEGLVHNVLAIQECFIFRHALERSITKFKCIITTDDLVHYPFFICYAFFLSVDFYFHMLMEPSNHG